MPTSSSSRVAGGLALAVLSGFLIAFVGPERISGAAAPGVSVEAPVLLVSGNEKGFLRPCGCTKPALGGIHRRAEGIRTLREEHPGVVLVSGGDLVVEGGRQQQLKFDAFLLALAGMGYGALVPGPGEFLLGVDEVVAAQELAGFPFVLGNVKRGGVSLFPESLPLPGIPFDLTGFVPELPAALGLEVEPATAALARLSKALAKDRSLLVIWNGKESAVEALAKAIDPEARSRCLVAFGAASDLPRELPAVEGVRIFAYGSKGRDLCIVRPGSASLVTSRRLEQAMKGTEEALAILDGYRQSVRDEKLAAKWPRREAAGGYAGDAACIECHKEICEQLDLSAHERAFATLFEYGDQEDPECVRCHVVGFEELGGFLDEGTTPGLKNVQCESCHGPSELHAQTQAKTPHSKPDPASCRSCHDADNSPGFDFQKYWPKIAHPKKS